jgi:hypothetical protein
LRRKRGKMTTNLTKYKDDLSKLVKLGDAMNTALYLGGKIGDVHWIIG